LRNPRERALLNRLTHAGTSRRCPHPHRSLRRSG
jgi:hypothetical protein